MKKPTKNEKIINRIAKIDEKLTILKNKRDQLIDKLMP
jgi:hypothetical protein